MSTGSPPRRETPLQHFAGMGSITWGAGNPEVVQRLTTALDGEGILDTLDEHDANVVVGLVGEVAWAKGLQQFAALADNAPTSDRYHDGEAVAKAIRGIVVLLNTPSLGF